MLETGNVGKETTARIVLSWTVGIYTNELPIVYTKHVCFTTTLGQQTKNTHTPSRAGLKSLTVNTFCDSSMIPCVKRHS